MIATGAASDWVAEISDEVLSFESFLDQVSVSPKALKPESQFALKLMKGYIGETETVATVMTGYQRKIDEIERSPNIQKLFAQETLLKKAKSPQDAARIRREINYLKSNHAKKLTDLISNKQQVLHGRLKVLYLWKSILNYEINILDESKSKMIHDIIEIANHSGDEGIIENVRKRLKSLSVHDSVVDELKLDLGAVKFANIQVLQDTLNTHLDDVQKITKAVTNKKQIVRILHQITQEIRRDLPDAPPEPPVPVPDHPAGETNKETVPPPPPGDSKTRMVFTAKGKKK